MADAGLKLGIEGEREFKKALSEINDEMKLLGSEMKLVASEFDANDKSVDALSAKYGVMSKEVDAQRQKVDALKEAVAGATEAFGENDKRTKNWQKQLNLATADLNNMQKELAETKDELDNAGKNTSSFGEKLKDGLKKAGSELKSFGSSLASVGKKAASFTLKGLKTAAVAGGAALAGLATAAISAANNVASAGDQIDKESQKLNMSREAYQEWSYVLSQNGADIAQLGSGIDAMVMKMNEAEKGSEDVSKMFGELGISMAEVKNATPEQMFNRVVQGLQGMEDESRKAAIAQELLGGAGSELLPLLNSTVGATEKLKQEAHDLGLVMSDDAVDAAVKYTDSMDKMKRVGTALFQNITAELLPGFTMIADGFVGLATGQEGATDQIKAGISDIVGKVKDMLPMILDVIQEVLPLLGTVLVEALPMLITSLGEIALELVQTLVKALMDNWPAIKDAGLQMLKGVWEGIKSGGAWLWEKLKGWASDIVGDIKEFFGIHSPSTVFAGIGGYLAEGLGVGFEKEMDVVSRQMRDAVPTQFETSLDAKLRSSGTLGGSGGTYGGTARGVSGKQEIVLQINEREFGRVVVDASDRENARRDVRVVRV